MAKDASAMIFEAAPTNLCDALNDHEAFQASRIHLFTVLSNAL